MKQRIIEKKTEEMQEYMEQVKEHPQQVCTARPAEMGQLIRVAKSL